MTMRSRSCSSPDCRAFSEASARRTEKGTSLSRRGERPAISEYQKARPAPQAPQLHYDIGNVLYRQENWPAPRRYEQALGRRIRTFRRGRRTTWERALPRREVRRAVKPTPGLRGSRKTSTRSTTSSWRFGRSSSRNSSSNNSNSSKRTRIKTRRTRNRNPGQGEGEKKPTTASPQGKPEDQGEKPQPKPGEMTPEQAKKLLDRLSIRRSRT